MFLFLRRNEHRGDLKGTVCELESISLRLLCHKCECYICPCDENRKITYSRSTCRRWFFTMMFTSRSSTFPWHLYKHLWWSTSSTSRAISQAQYMHVRVFNFFASLSSPRRFAFAKPRGNIFQFLVERLLVRSPTNPQWRTYINVMSDVHFNLLLWHLYRTCGVFNEVPGHKSAAPFSRALCNLNAIAFTHGQVLAHVPHTAVIVIRMRLVTCAIYARNAESPESAGWSLFITGLRLPRWIDPSVYEEGWLRARARRKTRHKKWAYERGITRVRALPSIASPNRRSESTRLVTHQASNEEMREDHKGDEITWDEVTSFPSSIPGKNHVLQSSETTQSTWQFPRLQMSTAFSDHLHFVLKGKTR